MKVELAAIIKPISVNAAFQGRRFKTKECKAYEDALWLLLPSPNQKIEGDVKMSMHFYLAPRHYALTDISNLVKITEDILVKKGFIEDDRKVIELNLKKFKAQLDSIKIIIENASAPY